MKACPDCGDEITCAEVTAPSGRRFITTHDAEQAALIYRPEQGYAVRVITGRPCVTRENHES